MNTSLYTKIKQFANTHDQQLLELLTTITSIPSPTGAEEKKARWILDYLHRLGAAEAYIDQAGNVIYPYHIEKSGTYPVYGAHIDTVFNQVQKIQPVITGNTFAAPSCGDNSANVASLLFFITLLFALPLTLPQGAWFLFNVGEEGLGNLKGVRFFMQEHASQVSEMTAIDCYSDTFINTAVGSRRYRIDIKAQGGHSWSGFGNSNAIAIAASIISRLYQLEVPAVPRTTYNAGTISGGSTVNSIAEEASFTIDLRSEDKDALARIDQQFHTILHAAQGPDREIRETVIGERPCSNGAQNEALCQRLSTLRARHGQQTIFQSASTDANIPLSLGIPAISFGTCIGRRPHALEENLDIDSLVPGFIQLAEFILAGCH